MPFVALHVALKTFLLHFQTIEKKNESLKNSPYLLKYRRFTSKIDGIEGLNYHQRLRKLGMYSMERRDRF